MNILALSRIDEVIPLCDTPLLEVGDTGNRTLATLT
jgi:hypothetical protein